MSRRTLDGALAAALSCGAFAFAGVSRAQALGFTPCSNSPGFACTTVPVPLDRGGTVPGSVALSVERKAAGAGQTPAAVLALAGGPGQAALPLGEFSATAIAPALSERDLLVFDQRGTGGSDPLGCSALESLDAGKLGQLFEQCAFEIGPARGAYTTRESVEDIEAIRRATGYEKLVLYGTSYGTKVALQYAERYPQHVESLVLDSVVAPEGPEPFAIPSFQAIGAVLTELCSERACAGITSNPVGDLERLVARLRKHRLSGSAYDGSGHRHATTLDEVGLFAILEAGDLNPALRALLPAAVQSALRHEPEPLLRLRLLSEGLIPTVPNTRPVEGPQEIDEALFVDTSCEETPFPWQRAAAPTTRLAEALAYLHAQPAVDFYPFDATTALSNSLVPDCADWPDASAAPTAPSVPPDLPTLILSGAQDLRTPSSNARALAALIAGAQLEVVPFTGHSVLGSDFSGCATQAVSAFFAGTPVQPCTSSSNPFAPTPITPTSVSQLHAPRGLAGRPGRTLVAVLDTIVDLDRQVTTAILQADQELPSGSSFGGLHGGYARLTPSAAILRDLSFVAGIQLTGTLPVKNGQLQTATIHITGSAASPGTVRIGRGTRVTGELAGRRFDIDLAEVRLSRVAGAQAWPARAWPAHVVLPALAPLVERARPARGR